VNVKSVKNRMYCVPYGIWATWTYVSARSDKRGQRWQEKGDHIKSRIVCTSMPKWAIAKQSSDRMPKAVHFSWLANILVYEISSLKGRSNRIFHIYTSIHSGISMVWEEWVLSNDHHTMRGLMFHTSHTPCETLCAKLEALDVYASDLLADLYNSLSCRNRDTHYTWHRTSRRLVRQRGVSEECVIYGIVCKWER
jgi:hypothetical protein